MALLLLTHVALLGGGWLGYRRYHGSLSGGGGGGAVKETMHLPIRVGPILVCPERV